MNRLPLQDASDQLRLPHMGDYLRALRDDAGLTRADLRERARVSTSHIRDIECGNQRPTDQTLAALAAGVKATALQRRHLFAVRDAAFGMPAGEPELTAAQRQWLEEDTGLLLAYFDKRWNFLASNSAYVDAFPGIAASGHLLKWLFTPAARQVLLDWDTEVCLCVNWFRGVLARHHNSKWAHNMLAELQTHREFSRHWRQTQLVAFERNEPYLHLRDQDGGLSTVNVLTASVGPYTVAHIGRFVPYCGPGTQERPGRTEQTTAPSDLPQMSSSHEETSPRRKSHRKNYDDAGSGANVARPTFVASGTVIRS